MINKLNELDLDIKRCEIVLKENNYLDIVIAIEELHDKYKNTIDSISNISRDVVWNYSKKDIENKWLTLYYHYFLSTFSVVMNNI